ncbi:unnamed protein product [Cuscuta europaea]|uniref:Ubiquitin-like protease family profile domain-containing protein n=1 Tax=Cuscuta europaea TaxID=41803 RepID=A0A9P0ZDZ2_CUSEU|nr:unnamed protein product [Cuscuta europaea]
MTTTAVSAMPAVSSTSTSNSSSSSASLNLQSRSVTPPLWVPYNSEAIGDVVTCIFAIATNKSSLVRFPIPCFATPIGTDSKTYQIHFILAILPHSSNSLFLRNLLICAVQGWKRSLCQQLGTDGSKVFNVHAHQKLVEVLKFSPLLQLPVQVTGAFVAFTDAEFVYIQLNVGKHWVLLVLDIKKRKGESLQLQFQKGGFIERDQNVHTLHQVFASQNHGLPQVYEVKGEEPMGERPLEIEVEENCPQQDNA